MKHILSSTYKYVILLQSLDSSGFLCSRFVIASSADSYMKRIPVIYIMQHVQY